MPGSRGAPDGGPSVRRASGSGSGSAAGWGRTEAAYLALLLAAMAVCWQGTTRLFFAEDDFGLMHQAASDGLGVVWRYFQPDVPHFRPLTKGAYFLLMWKAFGLDAAPWHWASLGIHMLNTVLVHSALRRLGAGPAGGLLAASLFGLSTGHFTTVAWISCAQFLLAMTFVLVAVVRGVDALTTGRRGAALVSTAAYAVAVMCMEQAVGLPLFLAVVALLHPRSLGARHAARVLAGHFAVLAAFAALLLLWKALPPDGPYAYRIGSNTLGNLARYSSWALHFATVLPRTEAGGALELHRSHLLLAGLVVYLLARRRTALLALAAAAFLVFHLPTLGLQAHTFYHHTYVPSLGVLLLVVPVADDAFGLLPERRWRPAALAAALLIQTGTAYVLLRANETVKLSPGSPLERNWIVRRSRMAERMLTDVARLRRPGERPPAVTLLYDAESQPGDDRWTAVNVKRAVGSGAGLKLLYDDLELDVRFSAVGRPVPEPRGHVFVFDRLGHCRPAPPE